MPNTAASVKSVDKETYAHIDGEYRLAFGPLTMLKFGGRFAEHKRLYEVIAGRFNANTGQTCPANILCYLPTSAVPAPGSAYPTGFASGIDATFPRNFFRYTPDQLRAFADAQQNWDPVLNRVWTTGYSVKEKNSAIYAMTEFEQGAFSGNAGMRVVVTDVVSTSYQAITARCPVLTPCNVPGAISTSRFGTYLPQEVVTKHTVALPSLNVRFEATRDLIARFAVGRSLGRPNYNEFAGAVSLNDTLLTGSGGNPNLKPVTATNVDASLAWYFAPRAYASGGVFYQDIKDYVKTGVSKVDLFNITRNAITTYDVTSRIGVDAKLKGIEAAIEMPVASGFGVGANYTYIDSKDRDGLPLLGTSRNTYNLRGYYEDDRWSASLAWNYRSDFAIAFVGNGTNTPRNGQHRYAGYGALALSLGYKINDRLSVHFDGTNLNDPVRHTYFITKNATGYWHQSGRQYYLTLRAKL
jgi:iron complex outermembrane recepter protein